MSCSAQVHAHQTVREALEAVQKLNREAGISSPVLTGITAVAGTGTDNSYSKFCSELIVSIKACFSHFSRVRPHLAKMRAHQEFHKLRLEQLPAIWNTLTTSLGQPDLNPLQHQSVNREIFDRMMKDSLSLHLPSATASSSAGKVTLLADEQNAVRYASGYVVMKLSKKLAERSDSKAAEFMECLSQMANSSTNTSFYKYTLEWMTSIDRGGLFYINDNTFIFFYSHRD